MMEKNKSKAQLVTLEQMSRSDWGKRKKKRLIYYSIIYVPQGKMLVASMDKGICFLGFDNDKDLCINELRLRYPNAELKKQTMPEHQNVRYYLMKDWKRVSEVHLYVRGTDFQMLVWKELLNIPFGKISTYGEVAQKIGRPRSVRPVGRAVGKNPIACIIPCHRVIYSSGKMGNFFWGVDLKLKMLNCESCSGKKIAGYSNWEPTLF